jgi:hypothetical protein
MTQENHIKIIVGKYQFSVSHGGACEDDSLPGYCAV